MSRPAFASQAPASSPAWFLAPPPPPAPGRATALVFDLVAFRKARDAFWTDARLAELRRLYMVEGISQGLIARQWRVGKGMVSGKLDRLGWTRRKPTIDGRTVGLNVAPEQRARPTRKTPDLPQGSLVPLPALSACGCKFPTGQAADGQWLFCDQPRLNGDRSYCGPHRTHCGGGRK